MSIGMGAALGFWVISGVTFWSSFVALSFRFRPANEPNDAPAPTLDGPASRHASDHVLARSPR